MLRKVLDRRLGPVHQKGNTRELQSVLWNLGTGLKKKTFQFLGLHVHAKADAGNWKFGSSSRHSDRGRRRRLQKRCARRCIAADAHDASSNIRAAAVMRDVVPVTSADDALPHGTELASCRCCGGPSAMQHIGCDHACSSQARTTRRLRRRLQRHRKRAAISQFPVSGFPVSRLP